MTAGGWMRAACLRGRRNLTYLEEIIKLMFLQFQTAACLMKGGVDQTTKLGNFLYGIIIEIKYLYDIIKKNIYYVFIVT